MVLYKRKPVIYQEPPPLPDDINLKIWHIPETKEWFYSYDEYLTRIDYYMKRKFVCEITGNSCFTYFEALNSEKHEMQKVEQHFPEPLKEPVLRYLQFSTVPRLDLLVDLVYSKFKNDFYPGESVLVKFQDAKKLAKIKEKARFNAITDESGVVRPEYCSYRVSFDNNAEITVDEQSISRDRSHFTKWYVKTFIKLSVFRSSRIGAPWVVREQFAHKYKIPTEYPAHLQAFAPKPATPKLRRIRKRSSTTPTEILEGSQQSASKKSANRSQTYEGYQPRKLVPLKVKMMGVPDSNDYSATESDRDGITVKHNIKKKSVKGDSITPVNGSPNLKKVALRELINGANSRVPTPEPVKPEIKEPSYIGPKPPQAAVKAVGVEKLAQLQNLLSFLEVFAPKKSLVDDLQIPLDNDYSIEGYSGDNLKDFNYFQKPVLQKVPELQHCISEALQSWIFINVYHNALIIDTFTFDDFVNCFRFKNVRNLELLNEIFCSLLSCFMLGANEDPTLRTKGYEFDLFDNEKDRNKDHNANSNGGSAKILEADDKKLNGSNKSTTNNVDQDAINDDFDSNTDFPVATDGDFENEDYLLVPIPQETSYFDVDSEEDDIESEKENDESDNESEVKKDEDKKNVNGTGNLKNESGAEKPLSDNKDTKVKLEDQRSTENVIDNKSPHNKKATKNLKEMDDGDVVMKGNDAEGDNESEVFKSKPADNYGLDFNIYEGIELVKDPSEIAQAKKIKDESDGEDEKSEDEFEILQNNVSRLLYYRNISWQERLFKRNFKDGNWIVILLGVLSLVENVKKYKDSVKEINETLAPKNITASPSSVQNQFYTKMSIDLKIKALSILCELLVEGRIIRGFIENSMEEATRLRRDRLETIREYKAVMEVARDLNAECTTLLLQWKKDKKPLANVASTPNLENGKADVSEMSTPTPEAVNGDKDGNTKNKRRRRNFTLRTEVTEDEVAYGKLNPDFKKKIDERIKVISKADELRIVRKNIERKLVEIDCPRIRLIGKDKLFNRYWWFEQNGLPTLGKQAKATNLNDGATAGTGAPDDEDDDDDDSNEVQEETYLMGRLWVQGPSNDDNNSLLKIMEHDIENFYLLKESLEEKVDALDNEKQRLENTKNDLASKAEKETDKKGVDDNKEAEVYINVEPQSKQVFAKNPIETETAEQGSLAIASIKKEPLAESAAPHKLSKSFIIAAREIFDLEFSKDGSTVKDENGKLIYSTKEQNLSFSLTPAQRKLIEERPVPQLCTKDWRYYDSKSEIETLIRSLNPWGRREAKLRKELVNLKDAIDASIQSRRKALLADNPPEEEIELEKEINETYISDSEAESDNSEELDSNGNLGAIDVDEDDDEKKKKTPEVSKRRTRHSVAQKEQLLKELEDERIAKEKEAVAETDKPVKRVSRRELKRKRLEEHLEKKRAHQNNIKRLAKLKQEREKERCFEWVNSCAKERLGHTHYEGPPKTKVPTTTNKKKGRK